MMFTSDTHPNSMRIAWKDMHLHALDNISTCHSQISSFLTNICLDNTCTLWKKQNNYVTTSVLGDKIKAGIYWKGQIL